MNAKDNGVLEFPGPYYGSWTISSSVTFAGAEFKKIYQFLGETDCFPEGVCSFISVHRNDRTCFLSCLNGGIRCDNNFDCFSGNSTESCLMNMYSALRQGKSVYMEGGDEIGQKFSFWLFVESNILVIKDIKIHRSAV